MLPNNRRYLSTFVLSLLSVITFADNRLTGTIIGTTQSVDYTNTSAPSTTVNTRENAFDGDLTTFFASWDRSFSWVGLDLGTPHVITRVAWSPRNDGQGPKRVNLGVFEGANREDFMDAVPIYIINENGVIGQLSSADVNCSLGFRYVRYVGPSDARCNIAEVEFYGHEGEGDDSNMFMIGGLPTVSIHTEGNVEPYDKITDIPSIISIIGDKGNNIIAQTGGTRERGNYSRTFPKRPYRIKFDSKQNVLDAPAKAKKWTLINNYGDKTLMRNLIAFHLSSVFEMPYTPYGTAVNVIMNGEYKGCYQLCDQIEVNKNRVNITEMKPTDNEGEALTGGYLIEVDAYAEDEISWFTSSNSTRVTIKSPDEDEITTEQSNYIRNFYSNMENNWRTYLDTNTFLRHFLVGELSGNTDTYWSVYMYKQRGEDKLYVGPVWDFDIAFENDNRTYPINNHTQWVYQYGSVEGYMRTLTTNIINDKTTKAQLIDIWDEARHNGIDEESLLAFIDNMSEQLQESQKLNFTRWDIINQYVHQNPRIYGSYQGEVNNVKNYLKERITWIDNKLGYTFVPRDPEPEPEPEPDPVDGIHSLRVNFDLPYQVYSMYGQLVSTNLNAVPDGVYVVRQGGVARKTIVRK
ncbi:MAG: CotH kinase family protein [Prevotella sp.]|nr:CotH kinase family protein [Prevotella sp.]